MLADAKVTKNGDIELARCRILVGERRIAVLEALESDPAQVDLFREILDSRDPPVGSDIVLLLVRQARVAG